MSARTKAIIAVLLGAVAIALLGWWEGHPAIFVAIYGLGLTLWQIWQREDFAEWLAEQKDNNLSGRWSQILHLVSGKVSQEQEHNKNLEVQLGSFRDLSAALPDGLVILDTAWRIIWFNAAAVGSLGLSPSDKGRPIHNLLRHPDFFDELSGLHDSLTIESPVDSTRSVSLQVVEISGDRRLLLAKDATAQRHAELARHDFVANASHELRSPLTVIRGYLDALIDADIGEEWRKPVKEMLRQSQRMGHLLTDLMDLSRLDRLHLNANLDPIDMVALIEHVRGECLLLDGYQCEISATTDAGYCLLGEQPEILSAVFNLVANAIRYSGENRQVSIAWSVDSAGGHLAVTDNGIGIPEDDIPRLTERFYRVDKSRSRKQGGTGLGLAIVRNTLSRHEGWLEIESTLAVGSTFTCHFPTTRIAPANAALAAI